MTTSEKEQLQKIREKTGYPTVACLDALRKNNLDIEKATNFLYETFAEKKYQEKKDRTTPEGIVVIKQIEDKIYSFKLKAETDFVTINDGFLKLGDLIMEKIIKNQDFLFDIKKHIALFGENITVQDIKIFAEKNQYLIKNNKEAMVICFNSAKQDYKKTLEHIFYSTTIDQTSLNKELNTDICGIFKIKI